MPTLILRPWITPDTDAILEAAQAAGRAALRLDSWRIPAGLDGRHVVLYDEPLFDDVVAPALGVALLQAHSGSTSFNPRPRAREIHDASVLLNLAI